ncbi:uncharacterized protein LOC132314794 [Cornus florida]|uniref:uncharacterized protein LOC132314794 n=1 Tax=Cornus florida TaxID=4283 RepID=UPI002899C7C7|nr:uncharacterized protein LOC132314794 [Cornus florida]
MDPEEVMNLFDSCWFIYEIFKNPSNSETNPVLQNHQNPQKPVISRPPTILVRSKSDELCSKTSFNSDSPSSNSIISLPHLQTILSGKEAFQQEYSIIEEQQQQPPPKKATDKRRRRKKRGSKSLSDLEFEELKGFMDLGFVFSEDDEDSSLVEIIPGLHRLAKKKDGEEEARSSISDESAVRRPYLSEAWEIWERRNTEKRLMDWRIPPNVVNEIDMKDSLKWWAHTVASAVR